MTKTNLDTSLNKKESLTIKTVKSSLWMIGSTGFLSGTKIIFVFILARLLTPEDFGVFSLATIFTNIFKTLGRHGVSHYLVQDNKCNQNKKIASIHINILFGFLSSIALFLSAETISKSINFEGLEEVLKMLSILPLFGSLGQVAEGSMQKDLKFKELSLINSFAFLISNIFIVFPLALNNFGVLSMVYGSIFSTFFTSIILVILKPIYFFKIVDINSYKKIIKFGSSISLSSIFQVTSNNIDNFFIGNFFGPEILGIYNIAFQILVVPTKLIGVSISTVLFPAISVKQNNNKSISKALNYSISIISLICFSISSFILVNTSEIVYLILGEGWSQVIMPLKILSLGIMARVCAKLCESAITAVGSVRKLLLIKFLNLIIILIGIYIGRIFNFVGTTIGVCIALNLNFLLFLSFTFKTINISWDFTLKNIFRYLIFISITYSISLIINLISSEILNNSFLVLLTNLIFYISLYASIYKFLPNLLTLELKNLREIKKKIWF